MTGILWLDTATIAVSLFNTILLVWLGLTVLLNARIRTWGVWLVGGGLLAGALFFFSHTAILGQEPAENLDGLNFWWSAGWLPLMLAPFAWYVAILWFGGFWAVEQHGTLRRHRFWLWGMVAALALLALLQITLSPIPTYDDVVRSDLDGAIAISGASWVILLFPLWMMACTLLALDVLRTPARRDATASAAYQRSRPWLLGTSAVLLFVALIAAIVVALVVMGMPAGTLGELSMQGIALLDLGVSLLIALATLLLGQAITAYELFSGRVLPRRTLSRHWRSVVIFALGFSLIVGWSIAASLRPVYSLLLATLLIAFFYALYSWRSFQEQEQMRSRLRPASPLTSADILHAPISSASLWDALCREQLQTQRAHLLPRAHLAGMGVAPLVYPSGTPIPETPILPDVALGITPLDPATHAPFVWSIPLFDARTHVGDLLVGAHASNRVYTEEELEAAQAGGERILHLLEAEQMVTRLREIQQKRTAEQRVMDLRTRRTLHDEVLPTLHLAILQLYGADPQQPATQESIRTLSETHRLIADLLSSTKPSLEPAPDPCEMVSALRALVQGEFTQAFEKVLWEGALAEEAADQSAVFVDALTGEVVLGAAREAMRNALTHGRGNEFDRALTLRVGLACEGESTLQVTIADDGAGFGTGARGIVRAGAGAGLALHTTLLAIVGGELTLSTSADGGAMVRITAPRL